MKTIPKGISFHQSHLRATTAYADPPIRRDKGIGYNDALARYTWRDPTSIVPCAVPLQLARLLKRP